jgi:hypothetical protein
MMQNENNQLGALSNPKAGGERRSGKGKLMAQYRNVDGA